MFDKDIIAKVKASTVAIGLTEVDGKVPLELWGTGFLVSPKGYVMTAGHVSDRCYDAIEKYIARGMKVERAVFFARRGEDGKVHFYRAGINERIFRPYFHTKPKGFAMSNEVDVAVYWIEPKVVLTSLEIRQPSEFELYEDVALCSYPAGFQSLNLSSARTGVRLSPIIQFGKIVGFMPTDDSPMPNGIQTDIIATGGSSGGAIVDAKGRVAGIALEVMQAGTLDVLDNYKPARYVTNVGLVYGLAPNLLRRFADSLDEFFEKKREDVAMPFETTLFGPSTFTRL